MPRHDLLALTQDDLESYSNRGLVKRALKELEAGDPAAVIEESAEGTVRVEWSDGVRCELPAGATISQAQCTCDATVLCRHVLRSVLAYQRERPGGPAQLATPPANEGLTAPETVPEIAEAAAAPQPVDTTVTTDPPAAPSPGAAWDPGVISDAELDAAAVRAVVTRARKLFNDGLVVELRRSAKPSAYIHDLGLLVRFLVPGDVRYARCDCGDPAPCQHAIAAVLSFRALSPAADEGLVETARRRDASAAPVLDELEAALHELLELGFSAMPASLVDRLRRSEEALAETGLVWPSEILHELLLECHLYAENSARFDSARAAALLGELLVRMDALRAPSCPAPPLFVGGSKRDKAMAIDAARLIGIGCEARPLRGGVRLTAYLQDSDSGQTLVMEDDFPDPARDTAAQPAAFSTLGATSYARGHGLAAIGAGQFLMKGGWRTPSGVVTPGRAKLTSYPHTLRWESLRTPLLCENFAEVRSHLATQFPACVRPRRRGANLFVVPLRAVRESRFDPVDQSLQAVMFDTAEEPSLLRLPYYARGHSGFTSLEHTLASAQPLFLAGHASPFGSGLLWRPVSLVIEEDGTRRLLQPWVDPMPAGLSAKSRPMPAAAHGDDTRNSLAADLLAASGDLLVLGVSRSDSTAARRWASLVDQGRSAGLDRFLEAPAALRDSLLQKSGTVRWSPAPAVAALLTTLAQARFALDLSVE